MSIFCTHDTEILARFQTPKPERNGKPTSTHFSIQYFCIDDNKRNVVSKHSTKQQPKYKKNNKTEPPNCLMFTAIVDVRYRLSQPFVILLNFSLAFGLLLLMVWRFFFSLLLLFSTFRLSILCVQMGRLLDYDIATLFVYYWRRWCCEYLIGLCCDSRFI